MKFRKKPVVVEAQRIFSYLDMPRIADWIRANGGAAVAGQTDPGPAELHIVTLEGTMVANVGDVVIRGVAGEFYPCKWGIFEATYEPADAPATPGDGSRDE